MKQYRFQCYAAGLYINSVVNAANDEDAIKGFIQNLTDKKYSVKLDGFRGQKHEFHLTYEELDNGATKVDIGEATTGVQMGQPSIVAG